MSSYETAIARMYALGHELAQTPSHKFDLAHMRVLLRALDNPERLFPGVLVAGTNGKGSTAATLASILRASGVRTGLYTSPHLARINERIQIGGEQIGDDDFALLQANPDVVYYRASAVAFLQMLRLKHASVWNDMRLSRELG
jgi:dihydrofolate synthase/folylpolyglutamate synthase